MELTVSDDPDWNHPDAWIVDEIKVVSLVGAGGEKRVASVLTLNHGTIDQRIQIRVDWPEPGQMPPGLQAINRAWLELIPIRVAQPVEV